MNDMNTIQIAIDGPVAAGKGTVAHELAGRLGFLNVDTGATYRVATLLALTHGVDVQDEAGIVELLREAEIEMRMPTADEEDGRWNTVLVDGRDVSEEIRKREIAQHVAKVAALPKVREELVKKQQDIAGKQSVVMEGRDITYVVLPDAQVKVYLDADVKVRARRRWEERKAKGEQVELDQILAEIITRDELDMNRESSPLQRVDEALYIDSTGMSVDGVVESIVAEVEKVA